MTFSVTGQEKVTY